MLNQKTFFIREHVGVLKLSNTYDILDPESRAQIGIAQEKPGTLIHILRFLIDKRLLPTKVFVYDGSSHEDESKLKFSIRRGITLFRSKVNICDPQGQVIGWLKSKAFSFGISFYVFDALGNEVGMVKGDWKGWNFRVQDKMEQELGTITKKWGGIGKELFTSADNYVIDLDKKSTPQQTALLLAACLAVDTIYKE